MKKWIIIAVIILSSLLVVLITFSLKAFYFTQKPDFGTILTSDPSQTVNLPFRIDDPAVISSRIAYVIEGKVVNKIPDKTGTELVTDLKLDNLPKVLLTQNTQVFYSDRSRVARTSINQIQNGAKVRIFIQYGLKAKLWTIPQVNIMVDKLPGLNQSTPSATTR